MLSEVEPLNVGNGFIVSCRLTKLTSGTVALPLSPKAGMLTVMRIESHVAPASTVSTPAS